MTAPIFSTGAEEHHSVRKCFLRSESPTHPGTPGIPPGRRLEYSGASDTPFELLQDGKKKAGVDTLALSATSLPFPVCFFWGLALTLEAASSCLHWRVLSTFSCSLSICCTYLCVFWGTSPDAGGPPDRVTPFSFRVCAALLLFKAKSPLGVTSPGRAHLSSFKLVRLLGQTLPYWSLATRPRAL